jgi:hypothetical protein
MYKLSLNLSIYGIFFIFSPFVVVGIMSFTIKQSSFLHKKVSISLHILMGDNFK